MLTEVNYIFYDPAPLKILIFSSDLNICFLAKGPSYQKKGLTHFPIN